MKGPDPVLFHGCESLIQTHVDASALEHLLDSIDRVLEIVCRASVTPSARIQDIAVLIDQVTLAFPTLSLFRVDLFPLQELRWGSLTSKASPGHRPLTTAKVAEFVLLAVHPHGWLVVARVCRVPGLQQVGRKVAERPTLLVAQVHQ